jgi:type I restriction enzyme S subunit
LSELAEPDGIVDGPFGSNLKSAHYTDSGARVIRLQNIGDGIFIDSRAYISMEHYRLLARHAVRPGDLVGALLGEILPRVCEVPAGIGPAVVKADCPRIRLRAEVSQRYVMAALNAPHLRRRLSAEVRGIGRPRLNLGQLKGVVIPLPSLNEQRRISAEIDDSSRLIRGLDVLIQTTLARSVRLRQAVLDAAFSGRLAA